MAYCQKCGNNNPDGSKFCSFCGETLAPVQQTPAYQPPINQGNNGYQGNIGYQPGAGYQQPGVNQRNSGYRQPGAGYQQPGVNQGNNGYQQSPVYQQSAGYQQPGVNQGNNGYQQPPAYQQSAGYQQPRVNQGNNGYQQPPVYQPGTGYQQPGVNQQPVNQTPVTPQQDDQTDSQKETKKKPKLLPIIIGVAALIIIAAVAALIIKNSKAATAAEPASPKVAAVNPYEISFTPEEMSARMLELANGSAGEKGQKYSLVDYGQNGYAIIDKNDVKVGTIKFFTGENQDHASNESETVDYVSVSTVIYDSDSAELQESKALAYSLFSCAAVCVGDSTEDYADFHDVISSDDFIKAVSAPIDTEVPEQYVSRGGLKYQSDITQGTHHAVLTFSIEYRQQ